MSIWNYPKIKKEIKAERYISLNEGNTPTDKLDIDNFNFWIKREELNPTGSWKDRGTAWKLTELIENNEKEAVISSTGNAAISFMEYINSLQLDFKMHIVISPSGSKEKHQIITQLAEESNHEVYLEEKAKKASARIAREKGIPLLRSSIDSQIVKGYWSLGFELAKLIKENSGNKKGEEWNIFCPVSSGTALVGMVQGIQIIFDENESLPRIFVCQTQKCHPLANLISPNQKDSNSKEKSSLADAISNQSVLRSPQILKIIEETDGDALLITDEELNSASEFYNSHQDNHGELTYNSLLSIAGFLQKGNEVQNSKNICIASGR